MPAPIAEIPPNRRANKAEAAQFFGISLPAIDGWIRRGAPAVQRGRQGRAWVFDLLEVARWRYEPQQGGTGADLDPEALDPKARRDWYEGERVRLALMEAQGQLVRAFDCEQQLATVVKRIAMTLETLPDTLERDAGLPGDAVERATQILDRSREELFLAIVSDTNQLGEPTREKDESTGE